MCGGGWGGGEGVVHVYTVEGGFESQVQIKF